METDCFTIFADELIEYILQDKEITFVDILRFSSTCKRFYKTVRNNNKLWRIKFFQRWPFLKEIYEENKYAVSVLNWLDEIKANIRSRKELMRLLAEMPSKYYKKQELSNSELKEFDPLFRPEEGAHPMAYYFLVDELIKYTKLPNANSNLTYKYYALKVLRYLRQSKLTEEWKNFITLPQKEQILERGAALVAQWSQPERHIPYSYVRSMLDDIAKLTKVALREQHPTHSIFSTPPEVFAFWKSNNIEDNQWTIVESKQIMNALQKVLFHQLGFQGNSEMFYSFENSVIDRVLECRQGIPITLAVIFESVARRLGIRCEAVSFPSHFLLRWKEKYDDSMSEETEYFYIDVFNGGQFLTKKNCPVIGQMNECPVMRHKSYRGALATETVARMASNVEIATRQHIHLNGRASRLRSILELQHMVEPHDANVIHQLSRFYILHQIDPSELERMYQNVPKIVQFTLRCEALDTMETLQLHLKVEEIVERKRTPAVKYAIGLIMKYGIFGYLCVITGWGMCQLSGTDRPFYNVILENGSSHRADQEDLRLAMKPQLVNHDEIGRYFCKFTGTYYEPNEESARLYPEDAAVRDSILAAHGLS